VRVTTEGTGVVAWLEEESMHEPLTLKKTQMDMLALLMRQPFDQLMMVRQSAQLEEEWAGVGMVAQVPTPETEGVIWVTKGAGWAW